jgi:hypothetical protein
MGKWLAVGFAVLALGACLHGRHGGQELVGKWTTGTTAPDGVHGTTATYDFKDGQKRQLGPELGQLVDLIERGQVAARGPREPELSLLEREVPEEGSADSQASKR